MWNRAGVPARTSLESTRPSQKLVRGCEMRRNWPGIILHRGLNIDNTRCLWFDLKHLSSRELKNHIRALITGLEPVCLFAGISSKRFSAFFNMVVSVYNKISSHG